MIGEGTCRTVCGLCEMTVDAEQPVILYSTSICDSGFLEEDEATTSGGLETLSGHHCRQSVLISTFLGLGLGVQRNWIFSIAAVLFNLFYEYLLISISI